jgi:alkylation response protein AidB-like acyl-CoA dehydrogenase
VAKPVLQAVPRATGYLLNGYSPWVTGASAADLFVVGASLEDGRQILLGVPRILNGVQVPPPAELMALEASQTGQVEFRDVEVPLSCLLQGPEPNVLQRGTGAGTGGLQTTTLAVGLARSAIVYLQSEAVSRPAVLPVSEALNQEYCRLENELLGVAAGVSGCSKEELRQRANSLVLRATQSALATAKGAGFTRQHPVGRWCREALFFLVWSCPQPVINANLCEFAGLVD